MKTQVCRGARQANQLGRSGMLTWSEPMLKQDKIPWMGLIHTPELWNSTPNPNLARKYNRRITTILCRSSVCFCETQRLKHKSAIYNHVVHISILDLLFACMASDPSYCKMWLNGVWYLCLGSGLNHDIIISLLWWYHVKIGGGSLRWGCACRA